MVSGSLDTSIRVWDAATGTCKHTLMGHQSLTSGMELRQNILVSGNADSTVKVWDITSGQCLQTLSGTKTLFTVMCVWLKFPWSISSYDFRPFFFFFWQVQISINQPLHAFNLIHVLLSHRRMMEQSNYGMYELVNLYGI